MSVQQRNALLFQWITSEVSFPVVHLHSYNSHIFFPPLNIKGSVRSDLQSDTIVGQSISDSRRKEPRPCLDIIPLGASSCSASSPILKNLACVEFPV